MYSVHQNCRTTRIRERPEVTEGRSLQICLKEIWTLIILRYVLQNERMFEDDLSRVLDLSSVVQPTLYSLMLC